MWLSFSVATTAGAADADSTDVTGVATGAGRGCFNRCGRSHHLLNHITTCFDGNFGLAHFYMNFIDADLATNFIKF